MRPRIIHIHARSPEAMPSRSTVPEPGCRAIASIRCWSPTTEPSMPRRRAMARSRAKPHHGLARCDEESVLYRRDSLFPFEWLVGGGAGYGRRGVSRVLVNFLQLE